MRALSKFANYAATRQDLVLITLLILIVFMMILPLPTALLDVLIGINLSLAVLVLIVSVYLETPTAFSTLPAVLLFTTLFRLAISISTTRMILVKADAGRIVETFGQFVLGGNVIVGIVVFLIITVVQFLVITKGSERSAEVSARFSLDALPGRQMSIDSDLRSGEIDLAEARSRREELQLESEFYGAMDGAMKFVKGDAIAGLIIIAVNILGGLGVGVGQLGMPMGEALSRYSVLTVGDGMVSQIPALLIAISSGLVITRITRMGSTDLGSDIAGQLLANPRALQIAGGMLLAFAAIPGFPVPVFISLGLTLLVAGFLLGRRQDALAANPDADPSRLGASRSGGPQDLSMLPMAPVRLVVGPGLGEGLNRDRFREAALVERSRLFDELGVPFPPIQISVDDSLTPDRWQLLVETVPVSEGRLPPGKLMITDDADAARIAGADVEMHPIDETQGERPFAPAGQAASLMRHGISIALPETVLARTAASRLPRHASEFLGVQEVGALLEATGTRYDSLVAEAQKALPLQKIAAIMRRLIEEEIPVRNMRILLETIIDWAGREKDAEILAEYVRAALARQISHRYASDDRVIAAYVIEADIEEIIRNAVRQSPTGVYLALEAGESRRLLEVIKTAVGDLSRHASTPILLASMDVRRFLRRFLTNHDLDFPVLSHKEVAPSFRVQPVEMLSLK